MIRSFPFEQRVKTPFVCIALMVGVILTSSCASQPTAPRDDDPNATHRSIQTLGIFDDYNEILRGITTTDRRMRLQFFDFEGVVTGMRCVGHGRFVHMPIGANLDENCEGIRGTATVTCTDERVLDIDYHVDDNCRTGWGVGADQAGNTLSFVYGLPPEEAEQAVRQELLRAAGRSRLETYRPGEVRAEQGFSTGTAFAIDEDGHFVTSHHVVADTDLIWLVDHEGNEHDVVYVRGDAENDVALLRAESFRAEALPIRRTEEIRKGDDVVALGYPLVSIQGQEQKATFGRVNALSGAMTDERFIQVDTPIQPGNSGGPLLDQHGNVVGVVTATLDQVATFRAAGVVPQNVNYALRTEFITRLLGGDGKENPAPTAAVRQDTPALATVVDRAEASVYLVFARSASK